MKISEECASELAKVLLLVSIFFVGCDQTPPPLFEVVVCERICAKRGGPADITTSWGPNFYKYECTCRNGIPDEPEEVKP